MHHYHASGLKTSRRAYSVASQANGDQKNSFCTEYQKQQAKKIQATVGAWIFLGIFGRDGVIRTLDPLHPMQVRYRAALRPDYILITSENDEESTLTC